MERHQHGRVDDAQNQRMQESLHQKQDAEQKQERQRTECVWRDVFRFDLLLFVHIWIFLSNGYLPSCASFSALPYDSRKKIAQSRVVAVCVSATHSFFAVSPPSECLNGRRQNSA